MSSKEKESTALFSPYKVWLCDLTHTQQTIASNAMPLGIGLIGSFAKDKFDDSIQISLFKYPEILLERLLSDRPHIIGFSNYIWNLDLSYSIALHIKKIDPTVVVAFGGPNYPLEVSKQQEFLRKRKYLDFYIYREGEIAFSSLLSALLENNFDIELTKTSSVIQNCHYLVDDNIIAENTNERIDLNCINSPYTTGLLDDFFDGKLMPLIQTNRGCPFSCTYCTESSFYYSKVSFRNPENAYKDLDYIAQKCRGYKNLNIADSNFGMYAQDMEIARYIAEIKNKYNFPEYIHVATGKNNKERVLKVAQLTKVPFRLSASVQSTNAEVLSNIKRSNVSTSSVIDIAKNASELGSNTYGEVILALPGDSKQAHFETIKDLLEADLNYIRSYTLMILKGTALFTESEKNKYGFITKFRVLPRCFGAYTFGGDTIFSVEIEEVCVANSTLSFEDYLECRLFALTIELFYNDGILSELLTFCKGFLIRPYSILLAIHNRRDSFPLQLRVIYDQFINETKGELFDSEEELISFAKKPDIIEKYIVGEYGSNLIFKYKALSFANCMQEIHDVAFALANDLISSENHQEAQWINEFLGELKTYSLCRKQDILRSDKTYQGVFSYDMPALEHGHFDDDIMQYKMDNPISLSFEHAAEQAEIINSQIAEYGLTTIGIGRILSRVHVKKLYRNVSPSHINGSFLNK